MTEKLRNPERHIVLPLVYGAMVFLILSGVFFVLNEMGIMSFSLYDRLVGILVACLLLSISALYHGIGVRELLEKHEKECHESLAEIISNLENIEEGKSKK